MTIQIKAIEQYFPLVLFIMLYTQGHPTRKERKKGLECSFLLSHIVLWSFKRIFVRANMV